ncbi:MAG TPA: dephospho-CoA kinase, partial [Lachnospiraceae bacterium]|nr:dephospho-CoA kinase [Lachnospiraceae bacterium]
EPGTECYKQIIGDFGAGILQEDGRIDRPALAEIVFGHPKELEKLNAALHPAVKEEVRRRIEEEKKRGTALFILEAALLLEDGYDRICDEIWYI